MHKRKAEPDVLTPYQRYENACRIAQGLAETPAEEYSIISDLLKFHPEALSYAKRAERFRIESRLPAIAAALGDD